VEVFDGIAGIALGDVLLTLWRTPARCERIRMVTTWTQQLMSETEGHRDVGRVLRRALLQVGFLEVALRVAGRRGIFHARRAFYPLFLLPDFHGPHFDEALRRLLLPGRGPFMVHLAVTGACPCRCKYCYAEAGGTKAPDLGDDRVCDIARRLADARVPLVILGGGEPLSRFERLLSLIEMLSPASEVRLATSGVGLTSLRATKLRDAHPMTTPSFSGCLMSPVGQSPGWRNREHYGAGGDGTSCSMIVPLARFFTRVAVTA
jgi:sulfatase maturation enzyme AslB (radical SAM superfamily)